MLWEAQAMWREPGGWNSVWEGQGAQRCHTYEWRNYVVNGSSCPTCPSWKCVDQRRTAQLSSSCISHPQHQMRAKREYLLGHSILGGNLLHSNTESEQDTFFQRLISAGTPQATTRTSHHPLLSFVFSSIFYSFSLFILQTFILTLQTQLKTFSPRFCFCLSLLKCLSLFPLEVLPFLPFKVQVLFTQILLCQLSKMNQNLLKINYRLFCL